MMEFTVWNIPVRISVWFPAMVIVMLSVGDETFTWQCLAASFLHECGHFAVMAATHDIPSRMCFGAFGVRVERNLHALTGYPVQAAVSFAGPVANLLCAVLLYAFRGGSDGVWIHLALGLFNLLPVEGLDGGEGVYRLLCLRTSEKTAHMVVRLLSVMVLLPLTALGFYLLFKSGGNLSLAVLSIYLILLLIFKEKH